MPAADTLTYCSWEGYPAVVGESRAYVWMNSKWHEVHAAEVAHEGRVMSKADFKERFPTLPNLPDGAFSE